MNLNDIELIETSKELYDEYYAIRSDRTDIYWNGYDSLPDYDSFRKIYLSRLSSARFTEPEDRRLYLIKLKSDADPQTVGFVQLIKHSDSVEIGYTVVEEYQRRGIATEALRLAIGLAKEHSKNIFVKIRDDNIASQSVAKNNGFVPTSATEPRNYRGGYYIAQNICAFRLTRCKYRGAVMLWRQMIIL